MKFVLVENPTYWWPVTVRVPDPSVAGQTVEQVLEVQFAPRDRDQALERQEYHATLTTDRERAEAEISDMIEIVCGWDGVVDGKGEPVPFSENTLRAALRHSWFRIGLMTALNESLIGKAAKRGN